eukprot:snap_masked-scaffold_50-processed-gene-1.74-mRNA-1 protein AED:1.00 eAED:1.00 QI:0/0/0/0/1/1/2/0/206
MISFIRFKEKIKLREKILKEWEIYAKRESFEWGDKNIIALDVSGPEKMIYLSRTAPYFTPQIILIALVRDNGLIFSILFLPMLILYDIFFILFSLLICLPLTYFSFLYKTTFVANEDKYGPFLSQNILVLNFGIFIYYGGSYQNYCLDLEHHPITLCSRECCKKDLPAETNLALKYCPYRIHFFRHNNKLRKEKSTNNIFKKDSNL